MDEKRLLTETHEEEVDAATTYHGPCYIAEMPEEIEPVEPMNSLKSLMTLTQRSRTCARFRIVPCRTLYALTRKIQRDTCDLPRISPYSRDKPVPMYDQTFFLPPIRVQVDQRMFKAHSPKLRYALFCALICYK